MASRQSELSKAKLPVTAEDAIRFLHFEASWCRGRNEAECFFLLLPVVLEALDLPPMTGGEAREVRRELRNFSKEQFPFGSGGRMACRNFR